MAKTKKDELKTLCSRAAKKHGLSEDNLPTGLEYLALETLAQSHDFAETVLEDEDPSEVKFERWHTGGPNDGKIDGILFDEERNRVAIIQTKYKAGRADSDTDSEARDFFAMVGEWSNLANRSKYNSRTIELLDDSQFDPKKQSIDLYFITSQTASESNEHNLIAETKTNEYQDAGKKITCHYLTVSDFLGMLNEVEDVKTGQTVKEATFDLPKNLFFVFNENNYRVLVATVKGKTISDLYSRKDVGIKLFNANVRSALTAGKINEDIKNTAADPEESKNFFYYNNGITATCSSMSIQGNRVSLNDLQVINGAQTVYSLSRALKHLETSDVYVLFRVIETGDAYRKKNKVADQITKYQNTQNPVKVSDFFSNEPFNEWIAKKIDHESGKGRFPQLWYEYKRGSQGKSTSGRKKINMETLAYLRYAAYVEAPFTYKNQKDIWSGGDQNFWLAFGVDGNGDQVKEWPDETWYETAWLIITWANLKKRHSELAKSRKSLGGKNINAEGSAKEINPESKYLGVLARYIAALSFNLMLDRKHKGDFSSFKDLLSKENEKVIEVEKIALKIVRKAVKFELEESEKWKSVANPRLNMPQDSETWMKLKSKVIHDFNSEIEDDYSY